MFWGLIDRLFKLREKLMSFHCPICFSSLWPYNLCCLFSQQPKQNHCMFTSSGSWTFGISFSLHPLHPSPLITTLYDVIYGYADIDKVWNFSMTLPRNLPTFWPVLWFIHFSLIVEFVSLKVFQNQYSNFLLLL